MSTRATSTCEHVSWQETALDGSASGDQADGPKLSRATVAKTFKGDLEGASISELLMCGRSDGEGGYIAQERIEGGIGGRSGSFVLHHGAIRSGGALKAFANIVPGSGVGELSGISGTAEYRQEAQGATLIIDYDFLEP